MHATGFIEFPYETLILELKYVHGSKLYLKYIGMVRKDPNAIQPMWTTPRPRQVRWANRNLNSKTGFGWINGALSSVVSVLSSWPDWAAVVTAALMTTVWGTLSVVSEGPVIVIWGSEVLADGFSVSGKMNEQSNLSCTQLVILYIRQKALQIFYMNFTIFKVWPRGNFSKVGFETHRPKWDCS